MLTHAIIYCKFSIYQDLTHFTPYKKSNKEYPTLCMGCKCLSKQTLNGVENTS